MSIKQQEYITYRIKVYKTYNHIQNDKKKNQKNITTLQHFTTLHPTTLHYTYRHFTPSHLHFTALSFGLTHLRFLPFHFTSLHFLFHLSYQPFTSLHFSIHIPETLQHREPYVVNVHRTGVVLRVIVLK